MTAASTALGTVPICHETASMHFSELGLEAWQADGK